MNAPRLYLEKSNTPLGTMLLVTDDLDRVRILDWEDHEDRMLAYLKRLLPKSESLEQRTAPSIAFQAMQRYFDGDIVVIDKLTTEAVGTEFQRQVWKALREIPHGHTTSYGQLASRIERPLAVRAVGLANGANPIGIIVPCHRVIGANQKLTGYGGGLHRKQWLLDHERTWLSRQ